MQAAEPLGEEVLEVFLVAERRKPLAGSLERGAPGAMPVEIAERSMRLFSKDVMPKVVGL